MTGGDLTWTLHRGSAPRLLHSMPDRSIDCVVTSPPYWGLRDYADREQIGREKTPAEYVAALVGVFEDCARVLVDSGTCWINLGDSYGGFRGSTRGGLADAAARADGSPRDADARSDRDLFRARPSCETGLKEKNLLGLPWLVAFALRDAGWILRADVIWSKPDPMPESVRDRVTKSHEYVFLFTKRASYFYDQDAIREPLTEGFLRELREPYDGVGRKPYAAHGVQNPSEIKRRIIANRQGARLVGANARSVWTIPREQSPLDHFAVMPRALARRCLMAGCPPGGIVLDPFAGISTTGVVALEEGRRYIGIELNPTYYEIGRTRLSQTVPLLSRELPGVVSPLDEVVSCDSVDSSNKLG
jgi:DNA modification methylase